MFLTSPDRDMNLVVAEADGAVTNGIDESPGVIQGTAIEVVRRDGGRSEVGGDRCVAGEGDEECQYILSELRKREGR